MHIWARHFVVHPVTGWPSFHMWCSEDQVLSNQFKRYYVHLRVLSRIINAAWWNHTQSVAHSRCILSVKACERIQCELSSWCCKSLPVMKLVLVGMRRGWIKLGWILYPHFQHLRRVKYHVTLKHMNVLTFHAHYYWLSYVVAKLWTDLTDMQVIDCHN